MDPERARRTAVMLLRVRDAFHLVKLLEDTHWDGMRHFDAHAYRTEDAEGVWDFARGCMRTYLVLREKARRFLDDAEISEALAAARVEGLHRPTMPEGVRELFTRRGTDGCEQVYDARP